MTVEVYEPGSSTVVETTESAPPVVEVHAQDSATVEVVEAAGNTVEVIAPPAAMVEVSAPVEPPTVEVIEQAGSVIEVHSGTGEGGSGVVTWDAVLDKPVTFPPSPHLHTVEAISDFPTAVQTLIDVHVADPTPHPAYDEITPNLILYYENGLI